MKQSGSQHTALRISLLYGLVAAVWIIGSYHLPALLMPAQYQTTLLQTIQAWGFAAVTIAVIYFLLQRELKMRQQVEQQTRHASEQAVVGERNRIARELHDSVTQALYSLTLYADATRLALEADETEIATENLAQLRAMAREAMLDMRLLIFELRPSIVAENGLVAAIQARLEAVEDRSGIQTTLTVEDTRAGAHELPLAQETELYRIAQEALNNVDKHSRASSVQVSLRYATDQTTLQIRDDGIGFDATAHHSGMGLHNIAQRVRSIGGMQHIASEPTKGTDLTITVPQVR